MKAIILITLQFNILLLIMYILTVQVSLTLVVLF